MALGVTVDSAMALPSSMNPYNYHGSEDGALYYDDFEYHHGNNTVFEMFNDCFDYHHSGEHWYRHDGDNQKHMRSHHDYNYTNNGEHWKKDYNYTNNGEHWKKDCFITSFMKHHAMLFGMPIMEGYSDTHGTITVMGAATTSVEPEKVVIIMGVETTKPTASAALRENSRLLIAAVDSVMSLGIPPDEISTSHISIYPKHDGYYDDDGRYMDVFAGYNVRNTIAVNTAQLNMTAYILDSAVQAGVNNIESVSFTVSDDTRMMVNNALIESAVLNAKHQAYLALKPLHYEIVGVKEVIVNPTGTTFPLTRVSADFEAFALTSTPIFTPYEELSVTVKITFFTSPDYSMYKK